MKNVFTPFVVEVDGVVDIEASAQNFQTMLENEIVRLDTARRTIDEVLKKAFDKYNLLVMPAIIDIVNRELNVPPDQYSDMAAIVKEYVLASPDYESHRGRNGGISRVKKEQ